MRLHAYSKMNNMKEKILAAVFVFGIASSASAQQPATKRSVTLDTYPATPIKKEAPIKTVKLDNRKIYNWSDGQSATPTGHEATSSNGSAYAALKEDTDTSKRKDQ